MTYVTDPIGDLLTRIRNAQHVRRTECSVPHSRLKQQLCELLVKEGYLSSVSVEGDVKKQLNIVFHPEKMHLELKRISSPGRRVYSGKDDLKPVLRGYGIAVVSTSQGLMIDKDARKNKIGGEILCTIA